MMMLQPQSKLYVGVVIILGQEYRAPGAVHYIYKPPEQELHDRKARSGLITSYMHAYHDACHVFGRVSASSPSEELSNHHGGERI